MATACNRYMLTHKHARVRIQKTALFPLAERLTPAMQPKFLSKKEREELAKKEAEEAAQLQKAKCAAPCAASALVQAELKRTRGSKHGSHRSHLLSNEFYLIAYVKVCRRGVSDYIARRQRPASAEAPIYKFYIHVCAC